MFECYSSQLQSIDQIVAVLQQELTSYTFRVDQDTQEAKVFLQDTPVVLLSFSKEIHEDPPEPVVLVTDVRQQSAHSALIALRLLRTMTATVISNGEDVSEEFLVTQIALFSEQAASNEVEKSGHKIDATSITQNAKMIRRFVRVIQGIVLLGALLSILRLFFLSRS